MVINKSSNEMKLGLLLKEIFVGLEIVPQYKFLKDRQFKFDFAIPNLKLAFEYEGGIWTKGRHTTGAGYSRDTEKYNLAVFDNWKIFRFTVEDLKIINNKYPYHTLSNTKQFLSNIKNNILLY